ncbi:hypothetical protein V6N12_065126 [Hibiscus sabdariffa]|uniref:Uncharacterized protein n=1 Tax=Hibiscus sabdariffa TaxID=183260 RepID=A0ABR2G8B6_9ROSI
MIKLYQLIIMDKLDKEKRYEKLVQCVTPGLIILGLGQLLGFASLRAQTNMAPIGLGLGYRPRLDYRWAQELD